MTDMKKLFHRWWRDLTSRLFVRKHYRRVRHVNSGEDTGQLQDDEIVLVGPTNHPKWAILRCPCGCGEVIHVNLMKSHYPHWTMTFEREGSLSFSPSLWVDSGRCGSHFLLMCGRVIWCRSAAATHWVREP